MKNENEKMQEVLANFTSEELLYEVHKRRDIYIEGWYNADHINENTDLPMQYCLPFIKWAGDKHICDDLESAVEQWLDYKKEELAEFAIIPWLESFKQGLRLKDFFDVMYSEELGFYAVLQDRFRYEFGTDNWDDLMEYIKPHHGNLETYLEEKMQELINEYFS